jgi:hypothetical protein
MLSDDNATLQIAGLYAALIYAEQRHPGSIALKLLHARLNEAMELYIADHPGVIRPYDGDPKPPG